MTPDDETEKKILKVPHTVALFLLFILLALLYAGTTNRTSGSAERIFSIRGHTISVETADTMGELLKGLGGRKSLSGKRGLFFVFPESGRHGIWMKGMLFPIDVVWLKETQTNANCALNDTEKGKELCLVVVDVLENLSPETFPEVFYPTNDARYVVELKAGTIQERGIKNGDRAILR